jgi:RNA polymerase sigma-70 factor, ECF subfamily
VQEAFIRLLNADPVAAGDEDRRRYLFRIAGNIMADRWRRSTREHRMRQRVDRAEPAVEMAPDYEVASRFAALTPRERALLWLAYVEGHDHGAIAESLKVKRGSVKVLLSRARARLRSLLG